MFSEAKLGRQKLILLFAVWTAYGLFFGTQEYIRDVYFGRAASLSGHLTAWMICGYSWAVLTFPVLAFARRFGLERLKWPRFLFVHIVAAVIFAAIQLAVFLVISTLLFPRADRGLWDFYKFLLANELQTSVLVYLAIIAIITVYDRFFHDELRERPAVGVTLGESATLPFQNGTNGFLRRIPVKENGKIVLVDTEDVNWIESYGNYLFLHTTEHKFIYRETISAMEKKLDPEEFVRIRRSTIVRVDQIKELHPTDNGEFEIVLSKGNVLFSTRRYRKNLEPVLKS
jgi:LytTr DNA-binding domain